MGTFIKGEIVVLPFPFSDLSSSKKRPAFVVSPLNTNDIILCQITSQDHKDSYSIKLENSDFIKGNLRKSSYIRPNRIFTADQNIIDYTIGSISKNKIDCVIDNIIAIIKS